MDFVIKYYMLLFNCARKAKIEEMWLLSFAVWYGLW